MRKLLRRYFLLYITFIALFIIQKPIFLLFYGRLAKESSWQEVFRIIYHGLRLDLSMASYLMIIPTLFFIIYSFAGSSWKWSRRIEMLYYSIAAGLISLTFLLNIALYGYWHFPLDNTPIFYFTSSPIDALASVSTWIAVGGFILWFLLATLDYALLYIITLKTKKNIKAKYTVCDAQVAPPSDKCLRLRWAKGGLMILFLALLFIPIRGGFTVSTTNTGSAYYSSEAVFNHAAVNPMFSLMESLLKSKDFKKQYRFMSEQKAAQWLAPLLDTTRLQAPRPAQYTTRPNVIIIVMESFSSKLLSITGGLPNVAVNLDSVARKNVLFTRFYANSFRTDRGLVSVLSGYPAQPTMSLMKYPSKTAHLPSICSELLQQGYTPTYYYGGDADFTNMRSYLVSQGFNHIVSDVDFPREQRHSKWGVNDGHLFERVLADFRTPQKQPFFKVIQTSSSHEPFDVPYHRLSDKRLNAFAYSDSVIGHFLRAYAQTPYWKNTLIVLVPDHLGAYPPDLDLLHLDRYQIPLIFTGGVIKQPQKIDVIGSQQDIAATLLASLGYSHKAFKFSKDMLHPDAPHFAFFSAPDLFGWVTDQQALIYDNSAKKVVVNTGGDAEPNLTKGKAYLQSLYNDIATGLSPKGKEKKNP